MTTGQEISNLSHSYGHIEREMTFAFSKLIFAYYDHLLYIDNYQYQ